LLLESLRNGVTWMTLRPDRALTTVDLQLPAATTGRLLRAEADRWSENAPKETDVAASAHATLSLVGQACVSAGLDPLAAVQYDIVELESRPYLAPYFGHRTR
jgi:inactivated superfamily I helicase